MIKRMELRKKMNNEQERMVRPLMWQPICDRRRTQRDMNATLKSQATAMVIGVTGTDCYLPKNDMLDAEVDGQNLKLLAASGPRRSSSILARETSTGGLDHRQLTL
jgi:hypothetical protein